MNENIEVNQEDPKENSLEDNNTKENNETSSETLQVNESDLNESTNTYTIIVDGQEQNYLIETYREMKRTNFLLYLLLISIVLMFVLSKFYYFAKSLFRIGF